MCLGPSHRIVITGELCNVIDAAWCVDAPYTMFDMIVDGQFVSRGPAELMLCGFSVGRGRVLVLASVDKIPHSVGVKGVLAPKKI